jgi:ribosomal protein S18 acetylase RimI-like enzyme
MTIRPFKLPQDIDLMNALVLEGFQYPENPAWSVQEDEIQDMVDRIRGTKRLWPLLSIIRIFVPLFRDIFCGFIDEEEGQPVGLINYMRQRNAPEWYIGNVTVLPTYRRRGIARRLVQATLDELRDRGARVAFLDVVVGNDPAFNLYKDMGFEEFAQSYEYSLARNTLIPSAPLPAGCKLKPLSPYNWKTRFSFAQRVTPLHVTHFEPISQDRFRAPRILQFLGKLFESAGGFRSARFAVYGADDEVVGIAQYSYRTRAGGSNSLDVSIDPRQPDLTEPLLRYLFSAVQKAAPGRRTELSFENWESALIHCAEELGCNKRYSAHRMGLRF